MAVSLWRCVCRSLNSTKRQACRSCGAERRDISEAERQAFTNVALPVMMATRQRLKGELHDAVQEERRLRKQARDISGAKVP